MNAKDALHGLGSKLQTVRMASARYVDNSGRATLKDFRAAIKAEGLDVEQQLAKLMRKVDDKPTRVQIRTFDPRYSQEIQINQSARGVALGGVPLKTLQADIRLMFSDAAAKLGTGTISEIIKELGDISYGTFDAAKLSELLKKLKDSYLKEQDLNELGWSEVRTELEENSGLAIRFTSTTATDGSPKIDTLVITTNPNSGGGHRLQLTADGVATVFQYTANNLQRPGACLGFESSVLVAVNEMYRNLILKTAGMSIPNEARKQDTGAQRRWGW